MKLPVLAMTVIAVSALAANAFAEDAPMCAKCEMMKKRDAAPSPISEAQVELNKLVTEMNSNIGAKKLEAMAAILTRLVDQANAKAVAPTANASADGDAAKEAHHH
jgi:hypothetical protein